MAKKRGYRPKTKVEDPEYIIYTDGGCDRNPGGKGGFGAVILEPSTGVITEIYGAYASSTNNRMEVLAVINALEHLPIGWTSAKIHSDSRYFVFTADGIWNGSRNRDLWKTYREMTRDKTIEYFWVKGHNGDPCNERCDELATFAMMNIDDPEPDAGYDPAEHYHAMTPSGVRVNTGSMSLRISVPVEYRDELEEARGTHMEEYLHNGLTPACAEGIMKLLRKTGPGFHDFAALKTGGRDRWSAAGVETLLEACGEEAYEALRENFKDNEKDLLAALRWYARGLPLIYAIRKTYVSREISENALTANRTNKETNK